ncbi:MAG: ABC transporter ATP-binding protein [Alphaproteobacteria bacterium]|nr:ABC transporter ATP-binding protein [Alphaproteobacteria bacterium]
MNSLPAALQLIDVRRTYVQGATSIEVLRGAALELEPGEIVALVGPSGAGKSTLLHLAGLLERHDGGEVIVAGQPTGPLGDRQRTALRRSYIGFVYQFHHLLPEFSALENVVVPQMIAGKRRASARARAEELLVAVGLADRLDHRPARLSGGEQQRVAIARALANAPRVLLADEPTGNLDQKTADIVFDLLLRLAHDTSVAALIATHNPALAARMDRTLVLDQGLVGTA